MKEAVIIITKNSTMDAKLYFCPNKKIAIDRLKTIYLEEIRDTTFFDYSNTYILEDEMYAQVSSGLDQTEMRVCEVDRGSQTMG